MFGRKNSSQDESPAERTGSHAASAGPVDEAAEAVNPAEAKKNRPTPKRSQQEAARRQPLVGDDRKSANKQAKAEIRRKRDEARIGLMQGDEKFLGPRDRGPQRRYVRDFVDARFSIGEMFIPFAFVVLLIGFIMPLILFLVYKDRSAFIRDHARQLLNASLSYMIYMIGLSIVFTIITIVTLGFGAIIFGLLFVPSIALLVFEIIAAVRGSNGEGYRIPLTIDMVK